MKIQQQIRDFVTSNFYVADPKTLEECGQRVYTALSLEDVIPADAPTVPTVQTDARGDYLTCPHCKTRIAMKRITTKGGVGFRLSRGE